VTRRQTSRRLLALTGVAGVIAAVAFHPSAGPAGVALPGTGLAEDQPWASAAGNLSAQQPGRAGLPILPPLPGGGSTSSPTPAPTASGPPTIRLDLSNLGGPLNSAIFGVDQNGGGSEGIWDGSPDNAATPGLFPSAAAATASMHLGMVRMEPLVNALFNCTPHPGYTDCGQYRWQDHIGPTAQRPGQDITMGPDDYMAMVRATAPGSPPFIVANMETATVQDNADYVAYMNGTSGAMAAQRSANTGGAGPYDVVYWEMGNEEYVHVDRLRAELADPARNPRNCPDYTLTGETDFTVAELYGCLLNGFSTAMRTAEVSSGGRVQLRIVANFTGSQEWMQGLLATAAGAFDDVDYHDYNPPSDSSNMVFDQDGQWQTLSVDPVSGSLPQEVTYAFWVSGTDDQGPPIFQATLDGTPLVLRHQCGQTDCTGGNVTFVNYAIMPQLVLGNAMTSPGSHRLAFTACAIQARTSTGRCPNAGQANSSPSHLLVNLRHVSTALGVETAQDFLGSGRDGMLPPSCTNWRPDPDTQIDTRVDSSIMGSDSTPWRLSGGDYATASTAQVNTEASQRVAELRNVMATQPGAGLFIGEHAYFGGCDAVPLDLTETHMAGIGAVQRLVGYLAAANASSGPLRGTAYYQLNSYGPNLPYCAGWALVREVSGSTGGQPDCLAADRPDQAYLTGAAVDLALAGRLTAASGGRAVPISISGPTVDLPRVVDQAPRSGVPAVTGVAFHYSDGSTRVLLVNTLAFASVSEAISGGSFTSASATTVTAAPEADNSDGAQQAVSMAALGASVAGGQVSITLPPFSTTLLILH